MSGVDEREELSLSKAAQFLLDECRMVLPGIQALFGFQLIAVFSPGFGEKLSAAEQAIHLGAITLAAMAIALIMTPAALHRQSGGRHVSGRFVRLSTRLLLWSMVPLASSICLDFYLIARVILGGSAAAALIAVTLFGVFMLFWFIVPRVKALQSFID